MLFLIHDFCAKHLVSLRIDLCPASPSDRFNATASDAGKLLPWLHCREAALTLYFFLLDVSIIGISTCECMAVCGNFPL